MAREKRASGFARFVRLWRRPRKPGFAEQETPYDRAFEKVSERIGKFVSWVSQQHELEAEFSKSIGGLPDRSSQEKWVRHMARIEPWLVALALLGTARRALTKEPAEPAHASLMAELALAATEQMDPQLHPPILRAGLRIQAHLIVAQAHRSAGRQDRAEDAQERAVSVLAEAAPELQRARFLRLLRHLRKMQEVFERMRQTFDQMADILEERLSDFES